MPMLMMKDSRGHPSITLTFVTVSLLVVLVKFALAGLTLPVLGDVPEMSGVDFAAAAGALLGIWWGREKTEKENPRAD
ncbi:hypothetical protein [Thiohalomonas denitrificans]|uniref:hypothetical protein n=1 Tax=Thiohalomonas denitrificans TaxID=415747 RepID=UPI0026EA9A4C|nr:hypothetical protein [Thiohalomonas denitrificans]